MSITHHILLEKPSLKNRQVSKGREEYPEVFVQQSGYVPIETEPVKAKPASVMNSSFPYASQQC